MANVKKFFGWEWISVGTKSIFKLASYIIELPMVASGIYIMIDTGIKANAGNAATPTDGMFTFAMSVLLASPEILGPGAFFRAETMEAQGKRRVAKVTRWLAGSMLLFAALTFSSIMIFHFPDTWLSAIMFCRVMVSLGYSIITRIDMEGDGQPAQTSVLDAYGPALPEIYLPILHSQAMAKLAEDQRRAIDDLNARQEQQNNLRQIEMQRLLSLQTQQKDVAEIDFGQVADVVMQRIEQQLQALLQQHVTVAQMPDATPDATLLEAPKSVAHNTPRNTKSVARNTPKLPRNITKLQPDATGKTTLIFDLLDRDATLKASDLARLAECRRETAWRALNSWKKTHGIADDTIIIESDATDYATDDATKNEQVG